MDRIKLLPQDDGRRKEDGERIRQHQISAGIVTLSHNDAKYVRERSGRDKGQKV